MIGGRIERRQIFEGDDGPAEQLRPLEERSLDREGDDLVGGIVREIFERNLGEGAIAQEDQLAVLRHGVSSNSEPTTKAQRSHKETQRKTIFENLCVIFVPLWWVLFFMGAQSTHPHAGSPSADQQLAA